MTNNLIRKTLALLLILTVSMLPALSLGEETEDFSGVTLNVYNWGEYIDQGMNVIRAFEKKYNCRVNYKTYESNEILYTQIEAGDSAWDILVPSDYMVQRLIANNMLQPLDRTIITDEDLAQVTGDPQPVFRSGQCLQRTLSVAERGLRVRQDADRSRRGRGKGLGYFPGRSLQRPCGYVRL